MEKYHISTLLQNEYGAVFGTTKWLIEANSRYHALVKLADWMNSSSFHQKGRQPMLAVSAVPYGKSMQLPFRGYVDIADAALILRDGHPDAENDGDVWSQTRFEWIS